MSSSVSCVIHDVMLILFVNLFLDIKVVIDLSNNDSILCS